MALLAWTLVSFMLLLLVKPLSPLSPACLCTLMLGILDSPRPLSLGFPSYFSPPADNALTCCSFPRQVPAPSRHSVPSQFMLFAPSLLALSLLVHVHTSSSVHSFSSVYLVHFITVKWSSLLITSWVFVWVHLSSRPSEPWYLAEVVSQTFPFFSLVFTWWFTWWILP